MSKHRFSQLSLYYLTAYLLGGGIGLTVSPSLALPLLLSNGDYGEVMPRAAGFLMAALGILHIQFIRQGIHSLYRTLIWIRLGIGAGLVWLYSLSDDYVFLTFFGISTVGTVLLIAGTVIDNRVAKQL